MSTFRALRHRNYALYFTGQLVSLTGTWMQTAVLMWLVHEWTGQSRWPAWMVAAQVGPTLLLGPLGGSLADRFPRRPLLLLTQAILGVLAFVMTLVVALGIQSPLLLIGLCLVSGVVVSVDFPARLAFVMRLVGREDLTNAVAMNALQFNLARMIGPALAAVLLPWLGPSVCLFLNGLSYLAVLLALLAMREGEMHAEAVVTRRPRLGEGFSYLASRPRLLLLLVLTGLLSLFGWPVLALLPALVTTQLQGAQNEYSLLLSAIGLGALLAALTVATFGTAPRRMTFLVLGVVLAAGSLLLLAQTTTVWLALLAAGGVGCGLVCFFATSQATTQLSAADHNRGLIMGIYSSVISGGQPLGNLILGPLADRWSVSGVIATQGLAILLAAGLIGACLLRLRR